MQIEATLHPTSAPDFDQWLARQFGGRPLNSLQPAEIRRVISELVRDDQITLAQALGDAALALHPRSEDVLAVAALLAELRQDWVTAAELLENLINLQDDRAPASAFHHLVRVLRCLQLSTQAHEVAEIGIDRHPTDPALRAEAEELRAWRARELPIDASTAQH